LFIQWTTVVYHVIFVLVRDLDYRMVTCAISNFRIRLEYRSNSFKRTKRSIRYSISYFIIRTCPSTFRPHEIIVVVLNKHNRTISIVFWSHLLIDGSILKGNQALEIIAQFHDITMSPTTIKHIVLPIFIPKYKLIYGLCTMDNIIDQWFADQILVGTFGLVCYCHTDSA